VVQLRDLVDVMAAKIRVDYPKHTNRQLAGPASKAVGSEPVVITIGDRSQYWK
jgi:hypothetical protein